MALNERDDATVITSKFSQGNLNLSPTAHATNSISDDLTEFYPQKLSLKDVLTLRQHSPVGLQAIERILMFDQDATIIDLQQTPDFRVYSRSPETSQFEPINKSDETAENPHPMDVLNVIFNCSDNILRQSLTEKLYLCRLSIPILLPDWRNGTSTFLLWAHRSVVQDCAISANSNECLNTNEVDSNITQTTFSLVDIRQTFISFLRIGDLQFSKSKLLNKLLSSTEHNTFMHRDCENGMSKRMNSNGTVEASWYWHLPSGSKKYESNFTLLNLRGNAAEFKQQTKWLSSFSHVVILMIDLVNVNPNEVSIISENIDMKKSLVIYLHADKAVEVEKSCTNVNEFKEYCKATNSEIYFIENWEINKAGEPKLCNEAAMLKKLETVINKYLRNSLTQKTLPDIAGYARKINFKVDEDDLYCKSSYEAASKLMELIRPIDALKRKTEQLPLQGEPWRKFTELRRKQFQSKQTNKLANEDIELFNARMETEQKEARIKQFNLWTNSTLRFMDGIYIFLNCSELIAQQYFVIWIELLLNKWSREIIPKTKNDYFVKLKEARQLSKNLSSDEELVTLRKNIDNAYFGIEHIFREFGQIYEAAMFCGEATEYSNLPLIVAELVLNGQPFELMDGDASFVPITWVQAVFEEIQKKVKNKKVFVISVIGIQSSGKSTLLNAMFGLKFPVSAGRCTRGLFCQLIPVDERRMQFDFVLVIDTEGLCAPEFLNENQIYSHDIELATFVTGLADSTVLNINGENAKEMNAILQIVTSAMVKIRYVKQNAMNPSCMFVHQNVNAINAGNGLKIGKEELLARLDGCVATAAQQENLTGIKRIQDVIHFDELDFNKCVPGLWKEQPPMACVSEAYCRKIKEIKTKIIESLNSRRSPVSISKFVSRMPDLWNAILNGDFISSYKNSEELNAQKELDEQFTVYRERFDNFCSELQTIILKEINSFTNISELQIRQKLMGKEITKKLNNKCDDLIQELRDYFREHHSNTLSEKPCKSYTTELENRCHGKIVELTNVLTETYAQKSRLIQLQQATFKCTSIIKEKAKSVALGLLQSSENKISEDDLTKHFEENWPLWLTELLEYKTKPGDVKKAVLMFNQALFSTFDDTDHQSILKQQLAESPLHGLEGFKFNSCYLIETTDFSYLKFSSGESEESEVLAAVAEYCKTVWEEIKMYVEKCLEGRMFKQEDALHIVSEIKKMKYRGNCEERGIMFEKQFVIQFAVKICKCSMNLLIDDAKNTICTTIRNELYRCFKSDQSLLETELVNNPLCKLEGCHLRDYELSSLNADDISFRNQENENLCRSRAEDECKAVIEEIKQYINANYSRYDFDFDGAAHVIAVAQQYFEIKTECGFAFSRSFQIKFIVDICKCIAYEFIQPKQYLQINEHLIAEVCKQKSDLLILFTAFSKSEAERTDTAVNYIFNIILENMREFVATNLSRWMKKQISKKQSCCLTKKQNFFAEIFIDFGEKNAAFFNDYIKYMKDENIFLRRKIQQYLSEALGGDDYKEVLQNKFNKLRKQLLDALSRVMKCGNKDTQNKCTSGEFENSLSSWVKYFEQLNLFVNNENKNLDLLFTANDLSILNEFGIHDFKQFTRLLIDKLSQLDVWKSVMTSMERQSECNTENFDSTRLISYLERTAAFKNMVDLLFVKLVGCAEKCPHCRAPCYYENANHAFKHNTIQHRPWGAIGTKCTDTDELVTYNCQSVKGSDQQGCTNLIMFDCDECTQLDQLVNNTNESEWEMKPDPTLQSSLYWRWFMNRFNKKLAEHFHAKPGRLPKEWAQIKWEDAKNSLFKERQDEFKLVMPPFCYIKIINKLGSELSPERTTQDSTMDDDKDNTLLISKDHEKKAGEIKNVVVCFAESRKAFDLGFLFDHRTVNVETGENVYWEKTIRFEGKFSPEKEGQPSKEKVYFGNNRNYWQVYFTHDGENYKINKNNAVFTLMKGSDNGETVTIEIHPYEDSIRVHFIAPSGRACFETEKGNRMERGILVKVKNGLPSGISAIRVLHAESKESRIHIETGEGVVWKEFVKFGDRKIMGRTTCTKYEIVSSNRIGFHNCKNYWQLYFTCEGSCYKLYGDNVNFNLSHKDNGHAMTITVLQKDKTNEIHAKFEILSNKKTNLAVSKIEDKSAKMASLAKTIAADELNKSKCRSVREETIRILREISELIGHSLVKRRTLFYKVPTSGKKQVSEDISPTDENISKLLELLKKQLEADKESCRFIKDTLRQIEIIRCEEPSFREPYQYLIGYGIFNEFITLTGINKFGITVVIGSAFKSVLDKDRESAIDKGIFFEHGIDPNKFADALKEELDLFNCVCSELEHPSERNYRLMNRLCFNALQREYEKFTILQKSTIAALLRMASELHENKQNVGIANVAGGVASILGGGLMIIGLILEIFTFGASTALIIAGLATATAGAVVNVGAGIGEIVKKLMIGQKNQQGEEPMLEKILDNLLDLLEKSYEDTNIAAVNAVDYRKAGIKVGGNVVRAFGGAAVKVGGEITVNILKNSIRFTAAGVGFVFDLLSVIDSGVSLLLKGGKSELGYKLAIDAEEMEAALGEQKAWIEELGAVMKQDDLGGDE